jgi:hypothetical protein
MYEIKIERPWETNQAAWDWYASEAAKVDRLAAEYPDCAIEVDYDVAEFMGAFDEAMDASGEDFLYMVVRVERDEKESAQHDLGELPW